MTTTHDDTPAIPVDAAPVTRRGWLLGASALAVLFASTKPADVQAAPVTDTWKLGGNANVNTDGTNFIGPTNSAPIVFKIAGVERMRILTSGNVGIGTTTPTARLQVTTPTGYAVFAQRTSTSGAEAAIRGDTNSTAAGAYGVLGIVQNARPGVDAAGVTGVNRGTNGNGTGVRGSYVGSGYGVHGTSTTGTGVVGETPSTAAGAAGVLGRVTSTTPTNDSAGVHGDNMATNSNGAGVRGTHAGNGYGVFGLAYGSEGTGVYGSGQTFGVHAYSGYGTGVRSSGATVGVYAYGGINGVEGVGVNFGVLGKGLTGVVGDGVPNGYGVSGSGYVGVYGGGSYIGVHGESSGGHAGYFSGKVYVNGNLGKAGGSFTIDHPLDPANKYLSHSFVESPDMMNIYNGNVVLDARGEAAVTMPAWFEALNMEFRYQLTCIGGFAPVYIADEIEGNRFRIAGGKAGMKVSWMVTGIRKDAWANANRIPVEETKAQEERGRYLHAEAFGKPASMSLADVHRPKPQPESDTVQPRKPAPSVTVPTE